jgi:hypothetical protein
LLALTLHGNDGVAIQPPVNPHGSSSFKLGSTVPLKFKLTGASANIANATATFSYRKLDGTANQVNEPVYTDPPTTGNQFRYDAGAGQYIYNWGTKTVASGAGTYELKIDLGDGVPHLVQVDLR